MIFHTVFTIPRLLGAPLCSRCACWPCIANQLSIQSKETLKMIMVSLFCTCWRMKQPWNPFCDRAFHELKYKISKPKKYLIKGPNSTYPRLWWKKGILGKKENKTFPKTIGNVLTNRHVPFTELDLVHDMTLNLLESGIEAFVPVCFLIDATAQAVQGRATSSKAWRDIVRIVGTDTNKGGFMPWRYPTGSQKLGSRAPGVNVMSCRCCSSSRLVVAGSQS